MFFTRLLKGIAAGSMLVSLLSCTEKVETGSVLKDFTGIETVEAISPTAVRVSWNLHERYKTYKVYNSTSATPLVETSFSTVIIRNLTASTGYTFKVIATDGSNSVGGNKELTVTTLTPFTGVDKVIKDADGNLILSWIYAPKVMGYQIFYKKYEDPTAANTNNWASVDYTTSDTKYIFRGLEGSTRYHFVVQVQYLDETFDHPTKAVNIFTNSTFPTPVFELSAISIGALPSVKVTPVVNSTYKNENYVSRMYSGNTPISDPLIGSGTMVFSPGAGITNGKIENLSLKVSYSDAGATETLIFDKLSTYIKGILGLNDSPPLSALSAGIAYVGESMTTGDFNCDGYPDLAVGMPKISLSSLGVKNAQAGAVYVYYSTKNIATGVYSLNTSGVPSRNPVNPGVDPQILTFDDLTESSSFGKSLSGSGNLNGDSLLGKACQDLIVGAPGYNTPGGSDLDGAAFVFFGSGKGLTSPSQIKDIQQNVETCNGLVEGATCSAVMLWPNMSLYPVSDFDASKAVPSYNSSFGYSVSFIGDFNADGYDDLAIGAPWASFDGTIAAQTSGDARFTFNAGYVAVYFGSKNGLGYETPKSTGIPTVSDDKFRFLKIYSPVPHDGQLFGYSVAGGADVDGKYKIRNSNDKLVGGSDMIIGAPGDRYANFNTLKRPLSGNGSCPLNCLYINTFTDGGWGGTVGTNYYGLPLDGTSASIGVSPGAAYIYFGRGAISSPPASGVQETPSRSAFWQCGSRAMSAGEHYSCMVNKDSFRVLFPRSYYKSGGTNALKSSGFGTAVALVGDPSRYDSNNSLLPSYSDTNGDGYADAVVVASRFQNDAITNSGALWTFYGNPFRLYEYNSFYQIDTTTPTNKDLDWNDSIPRCTAFTVNNNPTKQLCAPTLLRSNSIGSNYFMGMYPEGIAVADVSGDGLKDVIVGAVGDSTKGTNAGAVYAFTSLASAGLTTNFLKFYNTNGQAYDYFGRSVASGNFDGDFIGTKPLNDVAAGAYLDKTAKNGGGAVYGFNSNGQALSAVNSVPSFSIYDTLGGSQIMGYESIRLVGDINRDGYSDAVAKISRPSGTGTNNITDAVMFYGSKIGLISTSFCLANMNRIFKSGQGNSSYCYPSTTPAQGVTVDDIVLPQLISKPTNLSVGWAARAFDAGDINGDGFADVAFIDYDSGGQIVVYYGSRGGLQAVNNPQWIPAYGDPQIISKRFAIMSNSINQGGTNRINSRREIIFHGDFNGDGLSDLVITNPMGSSFFIMNKSTGINPGDPPDGGSVAGPVAANSGWQCIGTATDSGCNSGAQAWGAGRMWIYYGSTSGVQTPKAKGYSVSDLEPDVPTTLSVSASVGNYMVDTYNSEAVSATNKACPGSSASPNKNCKMQFLYDPFIENVSHGYDRNYHLFGSSVAVLDYDHDGIDDLVVAAPGWEDTPCYYDVDDLSNPSNPIRVRDSYGRIFLFKGSNNGLVAGNQRDYYDATYNPGECLSNDAFQRRNSASLNLDGSGKVRSLMPPIIATDGSTSRYFGWQVASAGDVNNDGYEDLVVTAPYETPAASLSQAGIAYMYYGPLCGNDNDTDMWLSTLYGNMNKQFQFSDPSINLPPMAECVKATGASKPAPMPFYVWDTGAGDYNGDTVMTGRMKKGDFNGDGFDDVILGSSRWDDQINGVSNFGRGVAFFGSSTGLHTADYPDSVVVADTSGHVKPYIIKRDETVTSLSPMYFFENTSAGDINGDGTMDIMVPTEYHNGYSPLIGVKVGTYFLLF